MKARRRVEEDMPAPRPDVEILERRARRVLDLHGMVADERWDAYGGEDYTVRVWVGRGIRVSHDNRADELEVCIVKEGGDLSLRRSLTVLLKSYGEIKKFDESLVDLANELIGKVIVLDELADS